MRVGARSLRGENLTYCTNIHPGETWEEIFENLTTHLPRVRASLGAEGSFPIGLRLSDKASRDLDPARSAEFLSWCREHGFHVATVNGFPFGRFHCAPVKEDVYLPDWRHPERSEYTLRLARLLAQWLPPGGRGSLSTVPLGFRRHLEAGGSEAALGNLRSALESLDHLAQETDRDVMLAVEPEPGCVVETTEEMVDLYERLRLPSSLATRLGVCYDCCHQAVQFEDPAASLQTLASAGIRVAQVQVSSALRLRGDLSLLSRFCEPCYLHQTVGRTADGVLLRYDDLPLALAAGREDVEEWRVHFHVPVFVERIRECDTTRFFLEEALPLFAPDTPLEVETYTWSVLPDDLRSGSVTDSIVREIKWVRRQLPDLPRGARPPVRSPFP